MDLWDQLIQNMFFQGLIFAGICIIFRMLFQKRSPEKYFWAQIILAAIAGVELICVVFYFTLGPTVEAWMWPVFLVGGLAFPKLPDLIMYIFSGKAITLSALWEEFITKAKEEYNPILTDILQYIIDNWGNFDLAELKNWLIKRETENIQHQLQSLQTRLQKIQAEAA